MDLKRFSAGTSLFREGDAADIAFLIDSGVVEISKDVSGTEIVLGEIRAGQLFAEMALINDQPRTASATAKEDTVCYVVPRAVFKSELDNVDAFMKAMVLSLIGHIHSLMAKLDRSGQGGDYLSEAADEENSDVTFNFPDGKGGYKERD